MISPALCSSYKREILAGLHRDTDRYMIALYGPDAALSARTTAYVPDGEAQGPGYAAGGQALQGFAATLEGDVAMLDWTEDPLWPACTVAARGALVYNATRGGRAVAVLDFGQEVRSTNGPFLVVLPAATVKIA